jgi:dTDP-4-amino-4,6-dideoxygalactose transaminase
MIPLFDLLRQYKKVEKEIGSAVLRVLKSGWYILGKELENFEKEFASYLGVRYAVGVASGTDALKIALRALGLTSEDEVILPANTYPTAFGVAGSGAKIRLVDIDPQTYNIDPYEIEKAITKRTKVIIPVHLYGQPADMEPILKIARKYRLRVVEDCAQAHGAEYRNKKVGSIGDVGCFSFYPTKPLSSYGDGGMIVTNNYQIYQRISLLRMYGEKKRYQSEVLISHSRLDEIQAAILRVKLKFLDDWNRERKKKAALYREKLSFIKEIILPAEKFDHVYHLFVIRALAREKLMKYLSEHKILFGVHYPRPIHQVKSFAFLGYQKGDFPVAEKISREILSLPLYVGIKKEEIFKVAKTIKEFYKKNKKGVKK